MNYTLKNQLDCMHTSKDIVYCPRSKHVCHHRKPWFRVSASFLWWKNHPWPSNRRCTCACKGKTCADLYRGGSGVGTPPPPEFSKLKIADISGNEKISYFFYICARQGWTPLEFIWIRAWKSISIYIVYITMKCKVIEK